MFKAKLIGLLSAAAVLVAVPVMVSARPAHHTTAKDTTHVAQKTPLTTHKTATTPAKSQVHHTTRHTSKRHSSKQHVSSRHSTHATSKHSTSRHTSAKSHKLTPAAAKKH